MSNLKDKYIKLKIQIKYFPKTIHLIWNASRYLMIAWASILIFLGVLPALQIYLIKPLIDGLSNIKKENLNLVIGDLYLPIMLLALTLFLTPILSSLLSYVRSIQAEKVQNSIRKKIQKKAISLDMEHFEDSIYYDKLHRAHIDAISKPIALLENVGTFFQNILTLFVILIILVPVAWWFPLLLILSIIPSLMISLKFILMLHNHRIKNTKHERKLNYLDYLMTNNESAAEVRTFNLGHYFKKVYWKLKHSIQNEYFSILKSQLKFEILTSLFSFLVVIIVMLFIVNETLNGNITIGSLVMYYFAFTQGQRVLKTLFSNISELYKNIMFIENLFEFLSIDNLKIVYNKKLEKNTTCTIEIKDLYFKYPKSNKYAISNLSINLKPNQVTAIVGTNGSGKSTLIKLLNAFYYPSSGSIKINGEDIKDIEPKSIRKNITILFQNFIKYNLKVKENISLANTTNKISTKELDEISSMVGITELINKLPNEYETVLGRWFGGVELSGGEWQKIALARAYLKNSKILILDEPTSAMDSWAESKWLEKFKSLCENKTALIITHRFTTAKHADIIHVMKDGQIVESGSHEELINLDSLYAKSWNEQIREFI
ncbi:MAG: ABC transporter ATP-binding protein [Aliarcobacter sp.]|nr:ABC transporter ATP-binding protein [Aliarcobacter sp.]